MPSEERGREVHLLVIDDVPEVRRLLVRALSRDYRVSEADNGEDGLELVARDRVDLVLSDVRMPRMSGLELLERLRGNPETADLPVLLVSSGPPPSEEKGHDGFLLKPCRIEQVRRAVARLLEARRGAAGVEGDGGPPNRVGDGGPPSRVGDGGPPDRHRRG